MNDTPCIATDDGRPCPRPATLIAPAPLCRAHQIEIALAVIPDVLRDRLGTAVTETIVPPPRAELADAALPVDKDELPDGVHDHVVYFIANGGRVKIGFTTNLFGRLRALSLRRENVLALLSGGPELERALHARFTSFRHGSSEWFELSPEVFHYVAAATQRRSPAAAPSSAASVLTSERQELVAKFLEESPGMTGPEIAERLAEHGYTVSVPTAKRDRAAVQKVQP
ncbi:GIY-YIG nuclease family protein [Nocardiopsis sp. CA-288880]|uniref:GIY-YIG nuclease family protein n=1 Tax=Nocardiopsis sp. CA-288880 TaxID=3239995 RepID=UPI003D970ABB